MDFGLGEMRRGLHEEELEDVHEGHGSFRGCWRVLAMGGHPNLGQILFYDCNRTRVVTEKDGKYR
jgi:hypothetical protein